jgi:hypothetical protein
MSRLARAVLIFGCLLSPAALRAEPVAVTGDAPRQGITVTIENATIDVVLEDLHQRYGFEVSGLENAKQGEPLSATLSGSLQSVLERLLRNWNHMIVRSADNESGIAKVMILNSTYGAAPQRPGQGTASGATNQELMQALSGEIYN